MLWFQGSIPEAILASKQRKLPFVVYIEGTDEVSVEMSNVWSNTEVSELLSQERCVAVKLANNSEECTQFSQLYPVVCVPSTFFIGENGMPLEVVGGAVSTSELISKTNTAFQEYHSNQSKETEAADSEVRRESGEGTSNQVTTTPESASSIEERVKRAKMLIEKKRQEKADKEKQEHIDKETRRREDGQNLVNAKREREEKKQQELAAQIKEERAQARAAREAVKQQIARDKAEREAQKQAEIRERQRAQETAAGGSDRTAAFLSPEGNRTTNGNSSTVRLQFRLPDGNSMTSTFAADALLEAARQYLIENLGSQYQNMTMSTTYPRRQLTDEDLLQTLAALGLAPSSTIIVSFGKGSARSPAKPGESTGILMTLLAPLLAIYNFIYTFLFGSPDTPRGAYGNNASDMGREEVQQDTNQSTERSDIRKRPTNPTSRVEGNIHRFRNSGDDDDENNTWNGNSTQQM